MIDRAQALTDAGFLRERATGYVPARAEDYPAAARRAALRRADNFALIDSSSGEILGTIEAVRAYSTVHEGAIYLHLGRSYLVLELDLAARRAILEPFSGNYFTQTKSESMTYIERMLETRETHGVRLSYGEVVYSETVLGYQRKALQDHSVIDFQSLDMPTTEFSTRALWYELDDVVGGPGRRPRWPAARPLKRSRPTSCSASPARTRARPDRGAAADRDVRPLGHRRPVHQRAPADRRPDDLHLRRPPWRDRHHPPRLRRVRPARRRRSAPDRRVPVHAMAAPRASSRPSAATSTTRCPSAGALELLAQDERLDSAAVLRIGINLPTFDPLRDRRAAAVRGGGAAGRGDRVRRRLGRRPPANARAGLRLDGGAGGRRGEHRAGQARLRRDAARPAAPAWAAKQLTTIDALAPGRLLLGVGVGGEFPEEFEALGLSVKRRGRLLDEALAALPDWLEGRSTPALAPTISALPPSDVGGRSDAGARARGTRRRRLALELDEPDRMRERGEATGRARGEPAGRPRRRSALALSVHVDADEGLARQRASEYTEAHVRDADFERVERYTAFGSAERVAEQIAAYARGRGRGVRADPPDWGASAADRAPRRGSRDNLAQ